MLYESTRMRRLLSQAMVIDNDNDDAYPWRPNQPQNYCDKTLYLFAVGVLVLSHAVLGLLVLCS
ncbi:hypothetical protein GH733_006685, partial [Mirounga leonina]